MLEDLFDTLSRDHPHLHSLPTRRSSDLAFIGGSLLASLGHERTSAQGISDAAHFCQALPPGPSRSQCVSDAAHGTGLFFQCQGDINRLCQSTGIATCCAVGQTCCSGTCKDLSNDTSN